MPDYIHFKVIKKKRETWNTVSLYLKPLGGDLVYRPGQFLTFLLKDELGKEIRRSYSLSSCPGYDPFPVITVKRMANGFVSGYFTEKLEEGEELVSLSPSGSFTLSAQTEFPRDIYLIGGGSGITPLFSLLKHFLQNEPQSRVVLLNANHNEQTIIFRKEIEEIAGKYQNQIHIIHLLSEVQGAHDLTGDGRLPVEVLDSRLGNALLERLVRKNILFNPSDARFFLCGPRGMMLKSLMTLRYMEFQDEQILREIFDVVEPFRPDPMYFPACSVILRREEEHFSFNVEPGQTVLQAAEAAGLDLPYSCRSGICTTCSAKCIRGKVEMYTQEGKTDSEGMNGVALTCVGYPVTEELELEM